MNHNWRYTGATHEATKGAVGFSVCCANCGKVVEYFSGEKPPLDGCTGPAATTAPKTPPKLKRVDQQTALPKTDKKYGPQCPNCGALTTLSIVPCPDGPKEISPGVFQVCAAVHLGWRCESCSACYVEET